MKCLHSKWHWTGWMTIQGVTKVITYRDKICNTCGKVIGRETK